MPPCQRSQGSELQTMSPLQSNPNSMWLLLEHSLILFNVVPSRTFPNSMWFLLEPSLTFPTALVESRALHREQGALTYGPGRKQGTTQGIGCHQRHTHGHIGKCDHHHQRSSQVCSHTHTHTHTHIHIAPSQCVFFEGDSSKEMIAHGCLGLCSKRLKTPKNKQAQ